MNKYYIPTTTLNFNNVLSSESISPSAFYHARSFGYGRWYTVPENPFDNSIILYDELRSFRRPISDIEDHPLLIEIALDKSVEASLIRIDEHSFLSDHTIYIDPFSSNLIFFAEKDRTIALSLSDSSIETKFVHLYRKKIFAIAPPAATYPIVDSKVEKQSLNIAEIEKDKKTNRMKGLLYGYYIGALLSASQEDIRKLNAAREIRDILAAILASFDHQATTLQRERLRVLYSTIQPEIPFLVKLSELIHDEGLFDAIVSLVRREYGFIRGEFNADDIITELLSYSANNEERNPIIENVISLIKQTEKMIELKAKPLSVDDGQIVVSDGMLANIGTLTKSEKVLYKAWINDVLSKDEYSGKTSTFREALSDDITQKAKEVCEGAWKGSYTERTLNALRRHVRGEEFPHNWNSDIISSMSALIVRGDDWQKLLQFMQSKEVTDYRIAFSMYGTINGFANLPRDFTDILFNRDSRYIAEVYREFYGQLFSRDIIGPVKTESNIDVSVLSPQPKKDTSDKENQTYNVEPNRRDDIASSSPVLEGFDKLMADIVSKSSGAKKDEALYKALFAKHGGLTSDFVNAVKIDSSFNKEKGVQQAVLQLLNKLVDTGKVEKPMFKEEPVQPTSLFADTCPSTGIFLSDFEFLVNCSEFVSIMSAIDRKWEENLKWFIDAHNPSNKDYRYYQDEPTDNITVLNQFIRYKEGRYRTAEVFLKEHYR